MESENVSSEEIRQQTGWFRGYDGIWRFEIDDSKMKITGKSIDPAGTKLADLITHKKLFASYPQLKNIEVRSYKPTDNAAASADFSENAIWVSEKILIDEKAENERNLVFESREYKECSEKLRKLYEEKKAATKAISDKLIKAMDDGDIDAATKYNDEYKKISAKYDMIT